MGRIIGRRQERERLQAFLEGGARLLTLVGPPGSGKTTLAKNTLTQWASIHPRGWGAYVVVAQGQGPLGLLTECAKALDISLAGKGTPGTWGDQLSRCLSDKGPGLLVLDDIHPHGTALLSLLETWLSSCPKLKVLTTSHGPLKLASETLIHIGPMSPQDGRALFRHALGPNAAPPKEKPELDELLSAVDILPLAIEQLAAKSVILGIPGLIKRLVGLRGPSPAQAADHAMALPWSSLSSEEREGLLALSIFPGAFDAQAAEVALGTHTSGGSIHLLKTLLDGSMLYREEAPQGPPRLSLYQGIRAYARQQPGFVAAQARALCNLAANARQHIPTFKGGPPLEERGSHRPPDPPPPVGYPSALLQHLPLIWSIAPNLAPGISSGLISHVKAQGSMPAFLNLLETLDPICLSQPRPSPLPRLSLQLAAAWHHIGQGERGAPHLSSIVDAPEDEASLAWALLLRGDTALADAAARGTGEAGYRAALEDLLEADRLFAQGGIPSGRGRVQLARANDCRLRDDLQGAEAAFLQAIYLCRGARDPFGEQTAQSRLGLLYVEAKEIQKAKRACSRSLKLANNLGDVIGKMFCRLLVCMCRVELGESEGLEVALMDTQALRRRLGYPPLEVLVTARVKLAATEGRLEDAEALILEAIEVSEDGQMSSSRAYDHCWLGVILWAQGRQRECKDVLGAGAQALGARRPKTAHPFLALSRWIDEGAPPLDEGALTNRLLPPTPFPLTGPTHPRQSLAKLFQNSCDHRVVAGLMGASAQVAPPQQGAHGLTLRLTAKAEFVAIGQGKPLSLGRKRAPRRILHALALAHGAAPKARSHVLALFEAGWPGARIQPESAMQRVYVALSTLRKLGLREVIVNDDEGYGLREDIEVRWVETLEG